MARLLLEWRVVNRAWLLAPILAASGCLFVTDVNNPPSVQLASLSASTFVKGEPIDIRVRAIDEGADDISLPIAFTVASGDATPVDNCDYLIEAPGHSATLRFFRAGTFVINASTRDRYGSPSNSATVTVTIVDGPPTYSANAKPVPTLAVNGCHLYSAGQAIPLRLDGTVADVDADAQRDDSCATTETLTYTWRIVGMPGMATAKLTPAVNDGCPDPDAAGGTTLSVADLKQQVCLWTTSTTGTATSMYSVALDVSDGTTTVASPIANIPVAPDQPPCITGTQLPAGSYVVDRTEVQTFRVTGVGDDLDSFGSDKLSFVWSIWHEGDVDVDGAPVWHTVPSHPGSSYSLDVSGFGVGEKLRVRVEAVDRKGTRASCALTADDCAVTSCGNDNATCNQWRTWRLELR